MVIMVVFPTAPHLPQTAKATALLGGRVRLVGFSNAFWNGLLVLIGQLLIGLR